MMARFGKLVDAHSNGGVPAARRSTTGKRWLIWPVSTFRTARRSARRPVIAGHGNGRLSAVFPGATGGAAAAADGGALSRAHNADPELQ